MVKTYYLRDKRNNPVATVAIVKSGHEIARGISICSTSDQFSYKEGRQRAIDRAIATLAGQCDLFKTDLSEPVLDALKPVFGSFSDLSLWAATHMMGGSLDGYYLGLYNPMLCEFEMGLMGISGAVYVYRMGE